MDLSPDTESQPRKLIYFPIVHNQADMGGLSESVKRASVRKIGRIGWKRKLNLIDQFWSEIEKALEKLSIPFGRVRIYQDGLPVSGREADIVRELAEAGSRNHALLLRLIDKGAKLMGTESLDLLLEEYETAKRSLDSGERPGILRRERPRPIAHGADHAEAFTPGESLRTNSDSVLDRRDRFIAERINQTLRPGEVGIVFLGMLHALGPWLAKDIEVIYPLHRPVKS